MPKTADARVRSGCFDRCANAVSLPLPQAAVGGIARAFGARVRLGSGCENGTVKDGAVLAEKEGLEPSRRI